MRCLSFRQPWLDLLISGKKTIEIRTWNTHYRGPLLLHAAKQVDKEAYERLVKEGILSIQYRPTVGAVVAKGILRDVFRYTSAAHFNQDAVSHLNPCMNEEEFRFGFDERLFGWGFTDIHPLREPLPLRGQLSFFEVPVKGEKNRVLKNLRRKREK